MDKILSFLGAALRATARSAGLRGLLLPALLVVAWELASRQGDAWSYALVPLAQIRAGLTEVTSNGELLLNLRATLSTACTGLLLGVALGVLLGALMGISRAADRVIGPLFHSVRQVPLLGWIPLIGLWFGNGQESKILMVTMAALYPTVLNTYQGMRCAERGLLEVAHVLRFSARPRFIHVLLPGSLPSIMTGVRHALAFSWIATVGAELLFVAGPGLGGLMQMAQAASRMDIVIICVISIGLTGLSMNAALSALCSRLLRWHTVN